MAVEDPAGRLDLVDRADLGQRKSPREYRLRVLAGGDQAGLVGVVRLELITALDLTAAGDEGTAALHRPDGARHHHLGVARRENVVGPNEGAPGACRFVEDDTPRLDR